MSDFLISRSTPTATRKAVTKQGMEDMAQTDMEGMVAESEHLSLLCKELQQYNHVLSDQIPTALTTLRSISSLPQARGLEHFHVLSRSVL